MALKVLSFLLLIIIITSIFITRSLGHHAFASPISPSFPRQLITDPPNDWYGILGIGSKTNCSAIKNIPYPDLSTVSYMSDGKFLNVTFWLTAPFEGNPSTTALFRMPSYLMSIGLISDYRNLTTDYSVSIGWDPISATWDKVIQENSPNDTRILQTIHNYNVSFDNTPVTKVASSIINNTQQEISKGHVNLSFDLGTINYPDRYFLTFGVGDAVIKKEAESSGICGVLDISDNAAFIPPPKFTISALQGPIAVRVNDNATIQVKVNSTIPTAPKISFSTVPIDGLILKFDPQSQNLTNDGFATSNLHLKVLENAIKSGEEVPYVIPIKSTIYFPKIDLSSALNSTIKSTSVSQGIDFSQKISPKPYYLTLTVLPKLTFQENLSNIVKEWISPIKELWVFLAAVGALVAVIIRKYRKRQ